MLQAEWLQAQALWLALGGVRDVGKGNDHSSYPIIKASCSSQNIKGKSHDVKNSLDVFFLKRLATSICGKIKSCPQKQSLILSLLSPSPLPLSPVSTSPPLSDRQTGPGWHQTCHLPPQLPKWGFFSVSIVPSTKPSIWYSSNKSCFLLCALFGLAEKGLKVLVLGTPDKFVSQ